MNGLETRLQAGDRVTLHGEGKGGRDVAQVYWVAALRRGPLGGGKVALSRTRSGAEQGRPTHVLHTFTHALPKVLPWGGGAGSRPNACTLRDVLRVQRERGGSSPVDLL